LILISWSLSVPPGGIATAISVVCYPFVSPAFRKICLPYVPATRQQIKNVIRALNDRSGSLIDLGSGDGRIVLAAAKRGFKAHGIELNTWLVWYSRLQAVINGLSKVTAFHKQDLWKHHLGKYDNVVIFGVDQMVRKQALCAAILIFILTLDKKTKCIKKSSSRRSVYRTSSRGAARRGAYTFVPASRKRAADGRASSASVKERTGRISRTERLGRPSCRSSARFPDAGTGRKRVINSANRSRYGRACVADG
ncbi:hypothetical protein ALC62_15676, partial [Cyphomyrmex costatus]